MHSSKLSTFVGNRVAEIQELTPNVSWRHVPSSKNPADLVSRGCSIEELMSSSWLNGPIFLKQQAEHWPSSLNSPPPPTANDEVKRTALLCQVQGKMKWQLPTQDLAIGDLVLVHENTTAPLDWPLGRIQNVSPGKDAHVRVATILTTRGVITRPVVKLARLPIC